MDGRFVNILLASQNGDFDEVKVSNESTDSSINDKISSESKESFPRESIDVSCAKLQEFSKSDNGNSKPIHPMRTFEYENIESDSIASSSSFEFHKGERAVHASLTRSCSRPMSSKLNDAEKWIMKKQNEQAINAKNNVFQNKAKLFPITDMVRVAPESANRDHRLLANQVAEAKAVDFCHPAVQMQFEKFSLIPYGAQSSESISFCTKKSAKDATVLSAIRSVCMRDMGTEMTSATSQELSRSSTPVGPTTPLRTPVFSAPSTPRKGEPMSHTPDNPVDNRKKELLEQEMKLKTRREIVALGVQLGKMNFASWASKDEKGKNSSSVETTDIEDLERIKYEKQATAWPKSHTARYKREEIKIQAWESQQRAKLEAEMRRIEIIKVLVIVASCHIFRAKVEQMRAQAQAQAQMVKIAKVRQRAEGKQAAAEA
ncbi:Remorin family protein isoform 3 [Hibiscus syriacus]|uniref:Remorin family protein isoform 3 n=1 Tax=Hibiscus syriacus TaxID=106335 RepID=A0A6A3ATE1_HIBSY|nr:Remorin family protein isoform 3 [Hibiscus syriacus]